jgi:alpha/beta superfamily hydrolase
MKDAGVARLISMGTPLDKYDFNFLGECRKPILFVHGELDEFGDVNRLRVLVEELKKQTAAELVVIKGADHFFAGHIEEFRRAITQWTSRQLGVSG